MTLPQSLTGPAATKANETRALAVAADRHAITPAQRDRIQDAMNSGMLPYTIKSPEQAVTIAKMGQELGMGMMQSFRSIHIIQGTPTMSANLMLGVCFRHVPTFDYKVIARTETRCALQGRRSPAHSWVDVEYTMADADRAGDTKKKGNNYARIPKDMLFARCAARLARMICPDTLSGLYDPSEVMSDSWMSAAIEADDQGPMIEPPEPPLETGADEQIVEAAFQPRELPTAGQDELIDDILKNIDREVLRATLIAAGSPAPTMADAKRFLRDLTQEDLAAFSAKHIPPPENSE